MRIKNLKVLCVVKQGDIYTRVVRQDLIEYFNEDFGSMKVSSVNTPELRMREKTLFVRGDQSHSHHEPHKLYGCENDISETIDLLSELNDKLKKYVPLQNSNG